MPGTLSMRSLVLTGALCFAAAPALTAQEPADTVYALSDVETLPRPTNVQELVAALDAAYPADKRAAGQEATVSLAFVVGPDGVPRDVGVVESTDEAFDSVTVASVGLLRFTPGTVAGRPVAVRVELPVQWRLPNAPRQAMAEAQPADFVGMGDTEAGRERAPVDTSHVYMLSEVDVQPQPVNITELRQTLQAAYPADLRAARVSGTVEVWLVVGTDGIIRDVRVDHSTHPGLEAATVASVRVLRFTPAQVEGRAVPVQLGLPVQWEPGTSAPEAAREAIAAGGKPSAHELSEVDLPPRPTNLPAFYRELSRVYPPDLRSAGVTATVQVRCVVTERGEVESATVTRSSDARFDAPTIEAMQILRFRPGQIGGHPVRTWVDLPIAWRL
jgi:TonB family protein